MRRSDKVELFRIGVAILVFAAGIYFPSKCTDLLSLFKGLM